MIFLNKNSPFPGSFHFFYGHNNLHNSGFGGSTKMSTFSSKYGSFLVLLCGLLITTAATAFTDEIHHTFQATPPTTNKGFTLGQIAWQTGPEENDILLVELVSVHLDFSRQSIRKQQIAEITSVLEQQHNSIIIMGGFNSDWFSEEKVVRELANVA